MEKNIQIYYVTSEHEYLLLFNHEKFRAKYFIVGRITSWKIQKNACHETL